MSKKPNNSGNSDIRPDAGRGQQEVWCRASVTDGRFQTSGQVGLRRRMSFQHHKPLTYVNVTLAPGNIGLR